MKKLPYFIPAILAAIFYGFVALGVGLRASPIVYAWVALFLAAGIFLAKGKFWGGFFGVLPGIHLMYMGTVDTGQIFSETPLGIIIAAYYLICCCYVLLKNKKAAPREV